ncbi:hypothetical protein H7J07_18415 [Mycobacterium koreense]|uniref:Uncharacterized protein n=1 Tax=Mycolicibacillus koreensis TaxID=1069220 RepID=A0A7I7SDK2_9MYCO|nr:hypothetical protein [Mycolicibacillus koreensis]MCV7250168.1 hypothetical protein [Mycolicibacillus koreensis]ODR11188.1 hypothetical protein BHQ15_03560 [Mycolicibacillus koreensis]OSC33289.1 hypothetical protein B8W67_11800 [Mycolicibacillus koreensis]BBY54813.1 hypothetical protein MKOR_20640 [Mycolicibacillus koreensis]
MEAVEINAGDWYLRGLRADDRVDDRASLADLGETDPQYVARAADGWATETRYTWAVCEPTTGELLAEVVLDPATAVLTPRARAGHRQAAQAAAESASRFAAGALGLSPTVAAVVEAGGATAP